MGLDPGRDISIETARTDRGIGFRIADSIALGDVAPTDGSSEAEVQSSSRVNQLSSRVVELA